MTLIDFVFSKLRTPKTWLDKCLRSHVSEDPQRSNMVNGPKTVEICTTAPLSCLLITAREQSCKKYLLLTCQILALFANILAASVKYPVLKSYNLMIPIKMQLQENQKTFSEFFSAFWNSSLNFELFEKKDDPDRFRVFEITDSQNVIR